MAIQLVQVEEWKAAAEAEVEGLVQGRQVRAEEWKVVEVVEGLVQGRPTLAAEWKVVEGLVPVRAEEWKVAEVVEGLAQGRPTQVEEWKTMAVPEGLEPGQLVRVEVEGLVVVQLKWAEEWRAVAKEEELVSVAVGKVKLVLQKERRDAGHKVMTVLEEGLVVGQMSWDVGEEATGPVTVQDLEMIRLGGNQHHQWVLASEASVEAAELLDVGSMAELSRPGHMAQLQPPARPSTCFHRLATKGSGKRGWQVWRVGKDQGQSQSQRPTPTAQLPHQEARAQKASCVTPRESGREQCTPA